MTQGAHNTTSGTMELLCDSLVERDQVYRVLS